MYKSRGSLLFNRYALIAFDFFHKLSREYVKMFLPSVGVSLTESFTLVSNAHL